ncbi:hypothetical protein RB598_000608 [Gaeumannomyces tritici]
MGRNKRGNNRRGGGNGGHFDGKRRADTAINNRYNSYPSITKESEKLQRFYDALLSFSDEEKEEFWAAYRRELPNSFRFCGSKGHASEVMKLMHTRYIPEITDITHDDQPVDPPKPVDWFPDLLAWWMTTPKNVVRKFPPFAKFQKFLVSETSVGNISRQEVVSMIPPLLLDVKPGMAVLDMCAAPGSKAAQLLEMLHVGEEGRMKAFMKKFAKEEGREAAAPEDQEEVDLETDAGDDGRATGLLIANDAEYKRCHMLVHQLKRLSSPNLLVTNHDATLYPSLRLPSDDPKKGNYLKFDRILADVPCSGDGTLRKNVNLWREWQPGSALGLHLTQTRILVRALQMLKVGGKVVYSTCSMNPVENEAVIAAAIERCGGLETIEILDSSESLPGLKRRPGLKTWKVMDKASRVWNSWEEVEEHHGDARDSRTAPGRLSRSMFPTTSSDAPQIPLERCTRIYPHLQDTGGFFIVVLQKKAEFKAKTEAELAKNGVAAVKTETTPVPKNSEDAQGVKREREEVEPEEPAAIKKTKSESGAQPASDTPVEPADVGMTGSIKEEPTLQPQVKEEEVPTKEEKTQTEDEQPAVKTEQTSADPPQELKKKRDGPYEEPFKYLPTDHAVIQLVQKFYNLSQRFPIDRFMVRNAMGEPAKAIYYTSALVRDILVQNEGRGVRFVHGGVKMFMKQDAPSAEVCGWRIQSEGMPILQGYVGPERVLYLHSKETLRKLLIEMFPKLADGGWKELGEVGKPAMDIGLGCCVLRVEPGPGDGNMERMALPLWKSFHSLNLMLPKEDRAAMLLRIFNETSVLLNKGLVKDAKVEKTEGSEEAEVKAEPEDVDHEEGGAKLDSAAATKPVKEEAAEVPEKMDLDETPTTTIPAPKVEESEA